MIPRQLSSKIKNLLRSFPIVAVTGPRQSGKTTLLKKIFPKRLYLSLEDIDTRTFAIEDPRRFLETFKPPVIFDEIQRVPDLFSYLQTYTDKTGKPNQYLLSGSQNFLLMEKVSQSLAGRIGILKLLPFSLSELQSSNQAIGNLETAMFTGFYPRIWDKKLNPPDWYSNYIQAYLERDVRLIKNISDLNLFQRFLKLCAGRTGQILNLSSFANDCGISHNTARSWLSILETSYIVFFLPPFYKNYNKRLTKSPKLYFYDAGLVCSLLAIGEKKQLTTHPLRGAIFETMVISEIFKHRLNKGLPTNAYFFRDKTGREVDCLLDIDDRTIAIEAKSGQTVSKDFFINLSYWQKISKESLQNSYVIYGGEQKQHRTFGTVFGWQETDRVFSK